jgi:transaldolase
VKIFLDTADVSLIEEAYKTGLIDGVTTNPSLILKSGRGLLEVANELSSKFPKMESISTEVVADTCEEMCSQAKQYYTIAPHITIKLPCTVEGLKACEFLSSTGIKTNVTLVFSVPQAILAAKAGATYISPFVGRLDDIGESGVHRVDDIVHAIKNYGYKTKVLAASIRSLEHVEDCVLAGADVITMPVEYFWKMYEHDLTSAGIKKFNDDWAKVLEEVNGS